LLVAHRPAKRLCGPHLLLDPRGLPHSGAEKREESRDGDQETYEKDVGRRALRARLRSTSFYYAHVFLDTR
jgi:hypothetical protein